MILAGDVGGTSTRLALYAAGETRPVARWECRSGDYGSLTGAVRAFPAWQSTVIEAACFGVAGPVRTGRVAMTNLPWVVDAAQLQRDLGIAQVRVINDLEALAFGVARLGPGDLEVLQAGVAAVHGHQAVIAAGTGLGEAILFHDGARRHPVATEGGHVDFAPRDALEAEFLGHLRTIRGRVSYERVLSGAGLVALYRFLRDSGRGVEVAAIARSMGESDPAAIITAAAGECALCELAVARFASIYGAEAGNLALKANATGGVFIGGGIAPNIIAHLRAPAFVESFRDKGRMRPLLEAMPLAVITNADTALLGAASAASSIGQ